LLPHIVCAEGEAVKIVDGEDQKIPRLDFPDGGEGEIYFFQREEIV
jgi:hypothetical protein